MHGRDYVLPDDLRELAPTVLAHRLLPTVEAAMAGRDATEILGAILATVPVPDGDAPGRGAGRRPGR
jgi:MoxR-like ATPase